MYDEHYVVTLLYLYMCLKHWNNMKHLALREVHSLVKGVRLQLVIVLVVATKVRVIVQLHSLKINTEMHNILRDGGAHIA